MPRAFTNKKISFDMESKTTVESSLQGRYDRLKEQQPKLRIRDAAQQLGVSELELLELGLGDKVVRLDGLCPDILLDIHTLGYVMALTRNEHAVHERKGVYNNVSFMAKAKMGLAVNPDIDLRLFMSDWKYTYAVEAQAGPNRILKSIQFFSKSGEAFHKIYTTSKSNAQAYEALVDKYRAEDQAGRVSPEDAEQSQEEALPDASIDVDAFREDWKNLKDTHDFFSMLKKHHVSRTQAMRLAPEGYTLKMANTAFADMLQAASEREVPIMVFVGNKGCIQIHSGPVNKIVPMNGWINVLDPIFNLHVRTGAIAEIWVTRKPTTDGIVTGLEVFDEQGELIVYCFGKRKPGIPELESWRELVAALS